MIFLYVWHRLEVNMYINNKSGQNYCNIMKKMCKWCSVAEQDCVPNLFFALCITINVNF